MALDDQGGAIVADFPEDFNKGVAAAAQAENARRLAKYNRACDNAQISIDAGRGDTVEWPTVPTKMEPTPPNADRIVYWRDLGNPLVDPPRKPISKPQLPGGLGGTNPNPQAGVTEIGAALGGGWFAAGPRDTMPSGTIVDTPAGRFQKVGFFMGSGWYQKLP